MPLIDMLAESWRQRSSLAHRGRCALSLYFATCAAILERRYMPHARYARRPNIRRRFGAKERRDYYHYYAAHFATSMSAFRQIL